MTNHNPQWKLSLLLLAIAVLPVTKSLATESIDIKEIMSAQEQSSTGIAKLSDQEVQALNAWLTRFTAQDAPLLLKQNESVKAISNADIHATIPRGFKGWSGDTLFKLSNGQIWKQRTPGRWRTNNDSVNVRIFQNTLGFWELQIEGTERSIGVKRVK